MSEFQFIYITKGRGKLILENESYELEEDDVFMICPDQWHTFTHYAETGWNDYYIGFSCCEVLKWIENSVLGYFNPVFKIGYNEELVTLLKRAIELVQLLKQSSYLHVSGILYHIIGLLSKYIS